MTAWYGLWFPAQTPQRIIERRHAEVLKVLPGLKGRLDDLGLVIVGSGPAEFSKFLQADIAMQAGIVKRAGIPQQ